jgi:hypothetical protein
MFRGGVGVSGCWVFMVRLRLLLVLSGCTQDMRGVGWHVYWCVVTCVISPLMEIVEGWSCDGTLL